MQAELRPGPSCPITQPGPQGLRPAPAPHLLAPVQCPSAILLTSAAELSMSRWLRPQLTGNGAQLATSPAVSSRGPLLKHREGQATSLLGQHIHGLPVALSSAWGAPRTPRVSCSLP